MDRRAFLVLFMAFVSAECHRPNISPVLRIRGGSTAAAQLAEIRARKAKEYECNRAKEVTEKASDSLNQFAWSYIAGKVNPSTISTVQRKIAQGDARNFYLDHGVTIFRNRRTGTVIEILNGNTGWFQFCAVEGSQIYLVNSGAGNMYKSNRWYVPGLIDEMKHSPIKAVSLKSEGLHLESWKVVVDGGRTLLINSRDGKSQLQLLDNGFVNLNCATSEVLVLDGTTGNLSRRPIKAGEWTKVM